jgi:hypothetical protein
MRAYRPVRRCAHCKRDLGALLATGAMSCGGRDAVTDAARCSRVWLYARLSTLFVRRMLTAMSPHCGSWRYVIDYDVDESIVAHEIRYFSEWIAAAGDWIAGASNSRHHLYFLTCGKRAAGHHRIRGCQFHGLREAVCEALCRERWAGLRGIAHEHK